MIDEKAVDTDVVSVGTTVHVKDQKTDKSTKFKIVGSAEANPAESRLSNESPVGRALLGHKRGETVTVPVPRGPARKLKITKIEALGLASAACRDRRPDDRRAKLERLREQGIDPFPHEFDGVTPIERVHAAHDELEPGEETDARLPGRRTHGRPARPRRRRLHRPGRPLGQAPAPGQADVLGEESFDRLVFARSRRPDRRRRHRLQVAGAAS